MPLLDAQNKVFTFDGDTVGRINAFNISDGLTKVIEYTQVSADERTFLAGLPDFGFITLQLYRDFDDVGQIKMEDKRAISAKVPCTFSLNGVTLSFIGFVVKLPIVGSDNGLGTADAVIKIASKVTRA
ncbi:MAG: hypothetical protein V4440_05410 [Pseudomonadota bacterium]